MSCLQVQSHPPPVDGDGDQVPHVHHHNGSWVHPYTFSYAVDGQHSSTHFNAAESSDGAGNAEGSYSVALPDGRVQHVHYHVSDEEGYVAEVTYSGQENW